MTRRAAALLAATMTATMAASSAPMAQEVLAVRPEDRARLDGLNAAAGQALMQLMAEGDGAQIAAAAAALRGGGTTPGTGALAGLAGDWSCRMTKIGGNLPAVSYPPFKCRLAPEAGGMGFEKLTGSQRTRGVLQAEADSVIYLGSTFVQGEEPKPYADFPETVDLSASETLPDVGVLELTGPDSARILFPRPYRESVLNVLTLTR